jgi:hypothetical protein
MVCIQRHFKEYHDRIKPGFSDGEEPLREKRDALGGRLERDLSKHAVPEDLGILGLRIQGSYQTRTTVKKVEGEIDIDVGLYLDVDIDAYGPVEVKRWVYEALKGHTHRVKFRRYCIRVHYQRGFHVDLAVYAGGSHGGDESYLAVGKRYSSSDQKRWTRSDPRRLHGLIIDRFGEDERSQLRRTVRYLKRWSELHFRQGGNEAPTGIALTTAAYKYFEPKYAGPFGYGGPSDLEALRHLTSKLLTSFEGDEIELQFPAEPHDDLFVDMSVRHQANLKQELRDLNETLEKASQSDSSDEACQILDEVFPKDFPTWTEGTETGSEAQFEEPLPVNGKAAGVAGIVVAVAFVTSPVFDGVARRLKGELQNLRNQIGAHEEEIKRFLQDAIRAAVLILGIYVLVGLLINLVSD